MPYQPTPQAVFNIAGDYIHNQVNYYGADKVTRPSEPEEAEVVPSLWRCITKKAIEEGLEDEVYQDIQESSRKTAPVLAKRLSFRARAGHIDICQFWKTDLYDELERVFGTLPYDKENFRKCDIYGVKLKQTA